MINKSNFTSYTVLILMISLFSACEKVIDIKMDSAEKKYVIEAVATDVAGMANVKISQTKNFNENDNFNGVAGATVSITETGGATISCIETSAGIYEAPLFSATPGKTYTLSVLLAGNRYSAVCAMPLKVNLDSVFVTKEFIDTSEENIVNVQFLDPAGRGNNYRFVQYINTVKGKENFVANDDYTDGNPITGKLFYFPGDGGSKTIESGDHVTIYMLCIDPQVYKYWYSLQSGATGNGNGASPANPVTNIKGGALGYFSVHSFQSKTMLVP